MGTVGVIRTKMQQSVHAFRLKCLICDRYLAVEKL
jgi:hypothetical protein